MRNFLNRKHANNNSKQEKMKQLRSTAHGLLLLWFFALLTFGRIAMTLAPSRTTRRQREGVDVEKIQNM